EKTAVEDARGLDDFDQIFGVLPVALPLDDDQQELRTYDRGGEHPEREIENLLLGKPLGLSLPIEERDCHEVGRRDHDAVRRKRERPDVKEAGEHGYWAGDVVFDSSSPRSMSKKRSPTPTQIAESATLKAGQWWPETKKSRKSTT